MFLDMDTIGRFLSHLFFFFSSFLGRGEGRILVLRVLVLIPTNEPLAKTELEMTPAFLMGKAG